MIRVTCLAFLSLCLATMQAQTNDSRMLTLSSERALEVPAFSFYGHGQCDAEGNLYFQIDVDGTISNGRVLKIEPSSSEPTLFNMPSLASKSYFINFSVSPSGAVWMLVGQQHKVFVLAFDSAGEPLHTIEINIPEHLKVEDFAVSDTGTIFLSGYFDSTSQPELQGNTYAALYNSLGKEITRIAESLPKIDIQSVKMHDGNVSLGDDRNFYLLDADAILVFSNAGTVIRTLHFKKAASDYAATKAAISGGYVAIWLQKTASNGALVYKFLVLDASTGEQMAVYEPAAELGNTPVCFSKKNGFVFYRNKDGRVNLKIARLR
jgi:hypothetical protein